MVQITDLRLNKTKKRFDVYIDGILSFTLNKEVVVKAGLHKGQDIYSDQINELIDDDLYQTCLNAAMNFLSYRPRSEVEVKHRLHKRGFNDDIISRVITWLKKQKLVDDSAFAQYWRDNRLSFNPRSKNIIKLELRQKGIDIDTISDITDELDDEESAYKVGLKKARFITSDNYDEFHNNLYNHLRRRGFNYEVISRVITRIWDELQASYK